MPQALVLAINNCQRYAVLRWGGGEIKVGHRAGARACCMVRPLASSSLAWPQALVLVSDCQVCSGLGFALAISGSTIFRGSYPVACASTSFVGFAPPVAMKMKMHMVHGVSHFHNLSVP